jgi:hypothetical protein
MFLPRHVNPWNIGGGFIRVVPCVALAHGERGPNST